MSVTIRIKEYSENLKLYVSQFEKDIYDLRQKLPFYQKDYELFIDRGIHNKQTQLYEKIHKQTEEIEKKLRYLRKISDDQIALSDKDLKKLKKEFKFKVKEISSVASEMPEIMTVFENIKYTFKPLFYSNLYRSEIVQHRNLCSENHKGIKEMDYDFFIKTLKLDTFGYGREDPTYLKETFKQLNNDEYPYIRVSTTELRKGFEGYFSFGDVNEISYFNNGEDVLYFQRIQYGFNLLIHSLGNVQEPEVSFFDTVFNNNKFIEETENHIKKYSKWNH